MTETIQRQSTPPLRRSGCNGEPATPYYVFGYAPTDEELLQFAKKYDILQGRDEYHQKDEARLAICRELPDRVSTRLASVLRDENDPESIVICHVVGTNANAKEMKLTKNKTLIAMFKDAFDTVEEPRWYKVDFIPR